MIRTARYSLRWKWRFSNSFCAFGNTPCCHYERKSMIRHRCFTTLHENSTRTSVIHQRELEGFMRFFLNTRALPLGTLKKEQWDEAFAAIEWWLQNYSGAGYGVDSAEHIFQRLLYEHATLNPKDVTYPLTIWHPGH